MNSRQLQALLDQTHARLCALSATKGKEYTGGGEANRLQNFLDAGERLGLHPLMPLYVAMDKHWNSITTYVRDRVAGRAREVSEPIESRLDDLILYAILAKGLIRELDGYYDPTNENSPEYWLRDRRDATTAPHDPARPYTYTVEGVPEELPEIPPGYWRVADAVTGAAVVSQVFPGDVVLPARVVRPQPAVSDVQSDPPVWAGSADAPTSGAIDNFVPGHSYAPGPAPQTPYSATPGHVGYAAELTAAQRRARAEDDGPAYPDEDEDDDAPVSRCYHRDRVYCVHELATAFDLAVPDIVAAVEAESGVYGLHGQSTLREEWAELAIRHGGWEIVYRSPSAVLYRRASGRSVNSDPDSTSCTESSPDPSADSSPDLRSGPVQTFDAVQRAVVEWASSAFPERSVRTVRLKLIQEAQELLLALALEKWDNIEDEIADVDILIHDLCALKGISRAAATLRKLEVNTRRSWRVDTNGLSHHVEPQAQGVRR